MKTKKVKPVSAFVEITMAVICFIFIYPVIFMIFASIRTRMDFSNNPIGFPQSFTLMNIVEAVGKMHFFNVAKNSIIITAVSLAVILFIGSMAAYPLSRVKHKLSNYIYLFFTAGMLVPIQICMVPLYKLMLNLKLMNNLLSCILVYCGAWMTSTIFIYTGFIKTIPQELDEASYIDGASKPYTFFRIVFPLLKPINATLAIITSIGIWNDFLLPLLYLQKYESKTVQLGLYAFSGLYGTDWTGMFSAMILTTGPMIILYIFSSKHIIKGISSGALKT